MTYCKRSKPARWSYPRPAPVSAPLQSGEHLSGEPSGFHKNRPVLVLPLTGALSIAIIAVRSRALIISRSAPRRVARSDARTRPPKGGKRYNYQRRTRAARARRHSEGARAERSAKKTSIEAQCELSVVMLHQRVLWCQLFLFRGAAPKTPFGDNIVAAHARRPRPVPAPALPPASLSVSSVMSLYSSAAVISIMRPISLKSPPPRQLPKIRAFRRLCNPPVSDTGGMLPCSDLEPLPCSSQPRGCLSRLGMSLGHILSGCTCP